MTAILSLLMIGNASAFGFCIYQLIANIGNPAWAGLWAGLALVNAGAFVFNLYTVCTQNVN